MVRLSERLRPIRESEGGTPRREVRGGGGVTAKYIDRAVACLVEPLWTGIAGSPIGIILV